MKNKYWVYVYLELTGQTSVLYNFSYFPNGQTLVLFCQSYFLRPQCCKSRFLRIVPTIALQSRQLHFSTEKVQVRGCFNFFGLERRWWYQKDARPKIIQNYNADDMLVCYTIMFIRQIKTNFILNISTQSQNYMVTIQLRLSAMIQQQRYISLQTLQLIRLGSVCKELLLF